MTAAKLIAAIKAEGGLHSRAGLAKRWGVSKAYVSEVTTRQDFPAPITSVDGRALWSGKAADAWRNTERRPGRPPAK